MFETHGDSRESPDQVAHLVSEKMALREQVERQQAECATCLCEQPPKPPCGDMYLDPYECIRIHYSQISIDVTDLKIRESFAKAPRKIREGPD